MSITPHEGVATTGRVKTRRRNTRLPVAFLRPLADCWLVLRLVGVLLAGWFTLAYEPNVDGVPLLFKVSHGVSA